MADKTYNVLNYTTSPVAISINRYDSIIVQKGSDDAPSSYPLTESEIIFANNTTNAFKSGALRFEPEYEAQLYEVCRIKNWENIMKNTDIEKIFTDFKLEKFKEIIQISDASYFNCIYGVFIGLRNAGLSIPQNVEQAMSLRYKELANGNKTTKIELTPTKTNKNSESEQVKKQAEEIEALKKQLEEFKQMLTQANATEKVATAPKRKASSTTKK